MIPSPAELNYFIEVSHTLNLSRAAERLGITQPTLTLAIQRLENSFGLPLLIRSKSGVKLTQAGHKLASQARLLFEEWQRIKDDALRSESEIRGRYAIGIHPSVALYSLPQFIPELLLENGNLEIKFVHDLSRKITEEVIRFNIDFGIVVNPWPHPDLIIKTLSTDEVGLWVSKKPNELQNPDSGNAVLICDPELLQSQELLKQLVKKGIPFKRTLTSSNLEVITSLVASQAGIGILPSRVAMRNRELGLKLLSKDAPRYSDKIALVYRADLQRSKASRNIASFIEKKLSYKEN